MMNMCPRALAMPSRYGGNVVKRLDETVARSPDGILCRI